MKHAQRALSELSEVMRGKGEAAAGKKRKQAVMDEILAPFPIKSADSSMKDSQKSGPKELDAKIASYFCMPQDVGLARDVRESLGLSLLRIFVWMCL